MRDGSERSAILLTGSSGFVGAAVWAALRTFGVRVNRLIRQPAHLVPGVIVGNIEDQHAVGLAQFGRDLARQFVEEGAVVPVGLAEELLKPLALAVVQVGDGLSVLAGQVGQQALDVVPGVSALLG